MGRVFSSKSSVFYRIWCWLALLPSYVNPEPLRPAPLSEEEQRLANQISAEDMMTEAIETVRSIKQRNPTNLQNKKLLDGISDPEHIQKMFDNSFEAQMEAAASIARANFGIPRDMWIDGYGRVLMDGKATESGLQWEKDTGRTLPKADE